jgi:hypothetical protein
MPNTTSLLFCFPILYTPIWKWPIAEWTERPNTISMKENYEYYSTQKI